MSYNTPSIDHIYESDDQYVPSEESSAIYRNPYFFESSQSMIEQYHYEPNDFKGSKNQLEISKKLPATLNLDNDFLNDDFKSPSTLKRGPSVFAMIGEKGEDLSQSIFSQSSSNSESDFSSNEMEVRLPQIHRKRSSKKNNKKSQQRVFKQIRSQSSQDSISKQRRNTSSSIRKGKHSQSKTQKFIYFCTQFHYSKNFNQYLRKQIIQKKLKIQNYKNSTPEEKISIIDEIIAEIAEYEMSIHYKVEESNFLRSFPLHEQNLIRRLFWRVIQKTYKTRLELEKKYIELGEQEKKPQRRRFFDQKGEAEFNKIFDSVLAEEPFAEVLKACKFEALLEEAMNKMSRKQQF